MRITLSTLLCLLPTAAAASVAQDPDADEESKRRLIRRTQTDQPDDVMDRVLDLMQQAGRLLTERLDAGDQTQRLQQQIIKELDLAISQAKDNLRRMQSASQQNQQRNDGQPDREAEGEQDENASSSGDAEAPGPTADEVEAAKAAALRERLRQWGNLPPRDRDEILQGIHEEIHEEYRSQADRYYRALAREED